MTFYPNDKVGLFVDGANFYSTAKSLNIDVDYKKLLGEFRTRSNLVRAYYFTALVQEQDSFSPIRPLIDWLDYNGFTVVTKPAKTFIDSSGQRRIRGDMDIELAVGVLDAAEWLDHVILFSGDGDFRALVEAVQRRGTRVTVVSSLRSDPPMISDDLRRQADSFIELSDMAEMISRDDARPPRQRDADPDAEVRTTPGL